MSRPAAPPTTTRFSEVPHEPAAIVADLVRMQARQLKMPGLARGFEDLARHAREEHWSHEDYLHDILAAEINSRAESAVKQRVRSAGFPEIKTLDEFDFAIADGVAPAKIADLAKGNWIDAGENVLLVGPIGTGRRISRSRSGSRQRGSAVAWRSTAPRISSAR